MVETRLDPNPDPTQLFIGFTEDGYEVLMPFILYRDPVMAEWVCLGLDSVLFELKILKYLTWDKTTVLRQYQPYQISMLSGFRKHLDRLNMPMGSLGATGIIVEMLRDSGYNVLPHKSLEQITPKMLDAALRERPDLYQRREMKEE